MRYIIAATAFALVVGITLGFVLSKGLDGSASAAPKAQAVEEQNLDGSGFIAVHEQGTADVNVLAMPPQAAPQGRLIELGTLPADTSETVAFPLVNVSDCRETTIMAVAQHTSNIGLPGPNVSPDGSTLMPATFSHIGVGVVEGKEAISALVNGRWPYIQALILNGGGAPPTDITAWLWCAP